MRTGWLFDLDVSVDGSRSRWKMLRKHTHIAGRCFVLADGFAQEPEESQPWAGWWRGAGSVSSPAHCAEAAGLLQAQGVCVGYTPYARAC